MGCDGGAKVKYRQDRQDDPIYHGLIFIISRNLSSSEIHRNFIIYACICGANLFPAASGTRLPAGAGVERLVAVLRVHLAFYFPAVQRSERRFLCPYFPS